MTPAPTHTPALAPDGASSPAPLVLAGHAKDLGGGFTVRRLLPDARLRQVGPFVFFDQMGPVTGLGQREHDVRPHPHIGLATLTYLFNGAMVHRDSTGAVQRIGPGDVNLMVAGRGVVHSERTPDDLIGQPTTTHGLQLWVALPQSHEEVAPWFAHTPAADLPVHTAPGVQARVLVGQAWGLRSPVATPMQTLYLDIALAPGAQLALDATALAQAPEYALFAPQDPWALDGQAMPPAHLVRPATPRVTLSAAPDRPARVLLIGGAPLDGPRHLWWNFVSSRRERIEQAARDWAEDRFPTVPGETERIPAPPWRPR